MPEFKITICDKGVQRIKGVVERYNQDQGLRLTVTEWIILVLKDICIADELAASVESIRKTEEATANTNLQAAIAAKRKELLAALGWS